MKVTTTLALSGKFQRSVAEIVDMERAGLDVAWVPEAYGPDAVSLMGYLAAVTESVEIGSGILPIYSRTPTLLAMTAVGMDMVSGGRFHLGLGASGPQVIEGWHGVPYEAPIGRTREIIDVCRQVWAREAPLVHEGRTVKVPLPPGQGRGLGKPLKIIGRPLRPRIPIWVASLGEKNVEMTAEVADGWIPLVFVPEKASEVWGSALEAGAAKRDPDLGPLMIVAGGSLAIGDGPEVVAVRERTRSYLALYIGGMGSRGANFYNDVARRAGYEEAAVRVQDLYLDGKKAEAEAAIPDELLERTSLCGPAGYVRERIAAFAEAGVTHLQVTPVPVGGQRSADLIEAVKELAG